MSFGFIPNFNFENFSISENLKEIGLSHAWDNKQISQLKFKESKDNLKFGYKPDLKFGNKPNHKLIKIMTNKGRDMLGSTFVMKNMSVEEDEMGWKERFEEKFVISEEGNMTYTIFQTILTVMALYSGALYC
jgi:hypothetical protein